MKITSLLLFLLLAACGDTPSSEQEKYAGDSMLEETVEAKMAFDESSVNEPTVISEDSQKIIKNAQLSFETQELENIHKSIVGLVEKYNGIIQQDNAGKGYNRLSHYMVVRIPSNNFQNFIDDVSQGVDYFDRRDVSRQDVTEEFVDLEARLKAKRKLEERYLELLKQARNVKEILEIERELSTIREEIESRQGRLEYLQSRVSMSTISIDFYKVTSETGITQSYGQKIINAIKGGWDGVSIFFIGLIYLWPIFVLVALVFLIIRFFIKRSKKKI